MTDSKIQYAQVLLRDLGMDDERSNERSAMVLLSLAGLDDKMNWADATNDMYGTRAIMDWIRDKFGVDYKPNTRETIRRFTLHQFVQAGLVEENADDPSRPINSPKWNYRLSDEAIKVFRLADSKEEVGYAIIEFKNNVGSWREHYLEERELFKVPVVLPDGTELKLTAGGQNKLLKKMVDEFCPRFCSGGTVLYIDDTGKEAGAIDYEKLAELGIVLPERGKAPDLIVWHDSKKWLFLMEACSTHGPIDVTRKEELFELFDGCSSNLVLVSCFPDRKVMQKYLAELAWETEAWCADTPDHMIHFNGSRFMGPYDNK